MRRALAIGCLATIAAADWIIFRRRPRWILIGLADEPAHLATAALVLLNLSPRSTRHAVAFLVGAVAIDADHLPLALAPAHPTAGDPRPRTHTLIVPAVLGAAAYATRPGAFADRMCAAAAGIAAHYLRDVASEAGIPALAPLSDRVLRIPYPLYAVAMVALALRAVAIR